MRLFSFFVLSLSFVAARADVVLAPVFGDHAVLQRDKPLPVWGRADAGERVTVEFRGQTIGATADAGGRWIVYFEPSAASSEPVELVATGKNVVRLTDLLVGDVWLCSGQSNMEWPVERAENADAEIAGAKYPLIRHIKIKKTVGDAPADEVVAEHGGWRVCAPETAAKFTAVGFFFARDLQPRLGVPIGLINSTYGGTPVEAWMSPAALAGDAAFSAVGERWKNALATYPEDKAAYDAAAAAWKTEQAAAQAKGEKYAKPYPSQPAAARWYTPSGLYNGMINPLLPVALRGVLWYQGETNAGRAGEYRALFSAMIAHWRRHLGQEDLPFFWVQLANYKDLGDASGAAWAFLREAQTQALALPQTGQALAIDIGDPDDIHPKNKQEVGRRLALIARAQVYGNRVDFSGPRFLRATAEGAALRVRFAHADDGLTARDKPLQSFEVAGADRKFFAATARIERDTVVVSAPEVKLPVAVRYAWANSPEANLYNGAGLPACPFRSDDW